MDKDKLTKIEDEWFVLKQQLKMVIKQNPQLNETVDYIVIAVEKQLAHEKMECLVSEE